MFDTTSRTLVIAPPPTPNGGLHLGHLSGPYLAADVVSRALMQDDRAVHAVISTDDFQTYVDVRAGKLGCSATDLLTRARADIQETVDRYALVFGRIGELDKDYCAFVEAFFVRALDAGLIEIAESSATIDTETGAYLHGPELPGYCGRCLAKACETICENCGEPNTGVDLLEPGLGRRVEFRTEKRLVVDLDRYRDGLIEWLNDCDIRSPKMLANLKRWLDRPLGQRALSRMGIARGIPAPHELPGQTIDPWAEMYPGHFYHLEARAGRVSSRDRYLQFLGFDNGYFYTILHGVLAVVARQSGFDWPRPDALIINRFYNLGDAKFSTSQGHAIWANEYAATHDTDLIRFYLALNGPEHDEASFNEDLAAAAINRIAGAINRVAKAYNECDQLAAGQADALIAALEANEPFECLSMKDIAESALARLEFVDALVAQGRVAEAVGFAPHLFTVTLAPLMPRLAEVAGTLLPQKLPKVGETGVTDSFAECER